MLQRSFIKDVIQRCLICIAGRCFYFQNAKIYFMGNRWIIGIDEVGRGPLAGPVTVAAVAVPFIKHGTWNMEHNFFMGIRDSKKCTRISREQWNEKICKEFPFAVASVSPHVIDKKGISFATKLAVSRCLNKLLLKCSMFHVPCFMILLDGSLSAPLAYKNQRTIVKGDEKIPVIAAASIMAKVHRDKFMVRLHKKYPLYGFHTHKGYGTVIHRAAIQQHGLCRIHRVSFCKKVMLNSPSAY